MKPEASKSDLHLNKHPRLARSSSTRRSLKPNENVHKSTRLEKNAKLPIEKSTKDRKVTDSRHLAPIFEDVSTQRHNRRSDLQRRTQSYDRQKSKDRVDRHPVPLRRSRTQGHYEF